MRVGQNPLKVRGSPAYVPKRVGLASLTYVPALEGYFREALQVIEVHLASLRQSLDQDCDLCVFDNGSCPEVVSFLEEQQRQGLIDWLCLSRHNLGKNGALNWIFAALPNEFIGYSDSDVLFRPGWLEHTFSIFDSFEDAGMVSAQPVFFDFLRGQGKTSEAIKNSPGLHVETLQPKAEIVEEYCEGINATEEQRRVFQQAQLQVAVHEQNGARAVISATDMQFVLRRQTARELVPLPIAGALTGIDAISIPRGIEELGYWLFSSEQPLVRHMGNSIMGRGIPEIEAFLQPQSAEAPHKDVPKASLPGLKRGLRRGLRGLVRRSPGFKRAVTRLYDGLFGILYEER